MSNKRIDLTRWRKHVTKDWNPDVRHENQDYIDDLLTLLNALERCYEEIDALRSITQDWVKIETFTDDGKDLSVDMEDSDGNCFSGYINLASE